MPDRDRPLVLVSNRGPVTYQEDGSVKRGTGGLVTALTGLASHRDAIWIASAMTDADVEVSREHGDHSVRDRRAARRQVQRALRGLRPRGLRRASTASSRTRCCGSSSTTCGTRATRRTSAAQEVDAFEHGYNAVNEDLARAVLEEIEDDEEPVVMVHDYHFYTLPGMIRRERPDVFLHHFIHIPWTQPDAWRVLPEDIRDADLQRRAGERHRRLPHALLPAQLPPVLPRPDGPRRRHGGGRRAPRGPRRVGARLPAADRLRGDPRRSPRATASPSSRRSCSSAGASSRSCASTAPTCPRTCCAASPASTSSSSSTRSSPSGSPSPRS